MEITTIINSETHTKNKCFIKKKYVCLFIFSAITEEVDENEKNNPSEKRKINEINISLSTFLHHFAIVLVLSLLKLNIQLHLNFFIIKFLK